MELWGFGAAMYTTQKSSHQFITLQHTATHCNTLHHTLTCCHRESEELRGVGAAMYTFIRDQAVSQGITVAGVLWCVAVCSSVLQCNVHVYPRSGRVAGHYCCRCVAVCCSVFQCNALIHDQAVA